MIDAIEGIDHTRPTHHATAAPDPTTRRRPQSGKTDTVEISDVAKGTNRKEEGIHPETLIKAKLGDPTAQRLIEEAAAKKRLLGLDPR